ncbi:hypothetical protein TPAR_04854 [Tolypocladium paradoxum]|uniref:Uncharacterized protein n=1 Tax=Tolypocladium paradoxum TaxID=94208 RepID=A0A2S4KXL6_9HYPO|nr:hypothetical protein TPAR_04854 [Tolypocladium paradoxum]
MSDPRPISPLPTRLAMNATKSALRNRATLDAASEFPLNHIGEGLAAQQTRQSSAQILGEALPAASPSGFMSEETSPVVDPHFRQANPVDMPTAESSNVHSELRRSISSRKSQLGPGSICVQLSPPETWEPMPNATSTQLQSLFAPGTIRLSPIQSLPDDSTTSPCAWTQLSTQPNSTSATSKDISGHMPRLSRRESHLLRLYVSKLGPLSDACDDARHFTLSVPRLALREPMILNGVLALASRYDALCNDRRSDLESTYYHSRCIERLIEALARPPETYDSTVLTAVVIARLYEEIDNDADTRYHHLRGTRNLLNQEAVARFASEGGLAEAASWIHLRQAIYVSLVRRQPVDIPLETFQAFTAFQRNDDTSQANRAVYIFAKILRAFFLEAPEGQSGDKALAQDDLIHRDPWEKLEGELTTWYRSKPASFESLHHEEPNMEDGRPFPSIVMISTVAGKKRSPISIVSSYSLIKASQVVAMQHYYAGRIICCLRRCNIAHPAYGFSAAKARASNEVRMISCTETPVSRCRGQKD